MEILDFGLNTKVEVAIEIIATKIAEASKRGLTTEDEELQVLLKERDGVYNGDEKIIDKIISVYGPEIKNRYKKE